MDQKNSISIGNRILNGSKITGVVSGLETQTFAEVSTISTTVKSTTRTIQTFWIISPEKELFVKSPFSEPMAIRNGQSVSLITVGSVPSVLVNHTIGRQFTFNNAENIIKSTAAHRSHRTWIYCACALWVYIFHITSGPNFLFKLISWAILLFIAWCIWDSQKGLNEKKKNLSEFISALQG